MHIMRLPIIWSLVCSITLSLSVSADFTVSGSGEALKPGDPVKLYRQDLDARSQTEETAVEIEAGGTFSLTVGGEPGYFTLDIAGTWKIPLAGDDGQHIKVETGSRDPADFRVYGSPDTDVLLAYENFRKDSLVRLVYPPRAALNKATAAGMAPEARGPLAQAEVDGYIAHKRELNDFTVDKVGPSIALYAKTDARGEG